MLTLREILDDFRRYSKLDDDVQVTAETRNHMGETPLHLMAQYGDHEAIKILCDSGSEIDAVDRCGNSPLHIAVSGIQKTAVTALIDLGANADLENSEGVSPRDLTDEEVLRWMRSLLGSDQSK